MYKQDSIQIDMREAVRYYQGAILVFFFSFFFLPGNDFGVKKLRSHPEEF